MSYCMFENTSSEMNQVLNKMEDAIQDGVGLDLNEYEKRAYQTLYSQCKEYVAMCEQFEGVLVTEE
jgi:hypothetical protein